MVETVESEDMVTLVSDPIVMVQAFALLRYGVVVHICENSVKCGHNFNQTLCNVLAVITLHPREARASTALYSI